MAKRQGKLEKYLNAVVKSVCSLKTTLLDSSKLGSEEFACSSDHEASKQGIIARDTPSKAK